MPSCDRLRRRNASRFHDESVPAYSQESCHTGPGRFESCPDHVRRITGRRRARPELRPPPERVANERRRYDARRGGPFMRVLSARIHGYLDYATVAILALAPFVVGLGGTPAL